jgi:hypothetical protein
VKRTPLNRRTPMPPASRPLERRTRIAARSAKRRLVDAERADLAYAHLGALCRIPSPVCARDAEHFHELVGRAQGGSLTDPRNLVPCADSCNAWIEDNPQEAYERGWKVRRSDAVQGDRGLVPRTPNPHAIANRGG